MTRTARGHEMANRSRLGKAARIGGLKRVEAEAAKSFPGIFASGLDEKTTSKVFSTFRRISETAQAQPKPPDPTNRTKVRWTDELIAQLRLHHPWVKDNKALARKLGLPEFCAEGVRLARRRHCAPATQKASTRPLAQPTAAPFAQAA